MNPTIGSGAVPLPDIKKGAMKRRKEKRPARETDDGKEKEEEVRRGEANRRGSKQERSKQEKPFKRGSLQRTTRSQP